MTFDPQTVLREQIAAVSCDDEQSLLEYLPLASRLAVLGDPGPLARWPSLVAALPENASFEHHLSERCREGIWDLRHTIGQDLAFAVVDAQDFFCFYQLEKEILPMGARPLLAAWAGEAEVALLDEDAAATLRQFLEMYPIPEERRLAVVDAPFSEAEISLLAQQAPSRRTIEVQWAEAAREESAAMETALFSAETPADRLKRVFERLDNRFEVRGVGKFLISRRVSDNWEIVIDLEFDEAAGLTVDQVRVGLLPARRVEDVDSERWIVDLRPFEHMHRLELMEQPVAVNLDNGYRLRVCRRDA